MPNTIKPVWNSAKGEYVYVCPSCKVEWTDGPGYVDEIKMIKTSNKCPACPELAYILTDEMIAGSIPVIVMNSKLGCTEQEIEGYAFIRKIHQGDRQGVHADVEFTEERGTTYQRWVFAKHQKAGLK